MGAPGLYQIGVHGGDSHACPFFLVDPGDWQASEAAISDDMGQVAPIDHFGMRAEGCRAIANV
jgi:hypothetical protein